MLRPLAAIALICASSHAQTAPAKPKFEVASVKPAAKDEASSRLEVMLRQVMRDSPQPGFIPMDDPGRIRLQNWALLDLIAVAYRMRASEVSGPSWLADQYFHIEAKVPGGTRKEQLNEMMQSLLEERFGLKVHRDAQTKSGFALIVGRNGPKLKPEEPTPAPTPGLSNQEQQADRERQAKERLSETGRRVQESRDNGTPLEGLRRDRWRSINTTALAANLARYTDGPVLDETGLTGKYSLTIETWKNPDVPGGTIFEAVEKLGLKLDPRKITVDRIIVDQVSKTPTGN